MFAIALSCIYISSLIEAVVKIVVSAVVNSWCSITLKWNKKNKITHAGETTPLGRFIQRSSWVLTCTSRRRPGRSYKLRSWVLMFNASRKGQCTLDGRTDGSAMCHKLVPPAVVQPKITNKKSTNELHVGRYTAAGFDFDWPLKRIIIRNSQKTDNSRQINPKLYVSFRPEKLDDGTLDFRNIANKIWKGYSPRQKKKLIIIIK